jgi:hypothetical protein
VLDRSDDAGDDRRVQKADSRHALILWSPTKSRATLLVMAARIVSCRP